MTPNSVSGALVRIRAIAVLVVLIAAPAMLHAATVTVTWDANTDVVAGYRISYGPAPGNYTTIIDAGNVTSRAVTLPAGRHYFVVQAYNAALMLSAYSNVVPVDIPGGAPVLTQPVNQVSVVGATVSLALVASDPDANPLTFSATGLPAGLAVTASTGRIAGTVTAAGTYTVTATASDGSLTNSKTFTWIVRNAGAGAGHPTSDFDNDWETDLALYRPSTGMWYIKQSSTSYATAIAQQWGLSTDVPVPGDYDGDGKADLGLYRPSTGYWYVLLSSTSFTTAIAQQWGGVGDRPMPGDYDGDGKTDLGLYRPSTGYWYVLRSSTNYTTFIAQQWGLSTDVPVPGDFDGDSKADLGLYRPSTGYWYVLRSSTNYTTAIAQQWGISTDLPKPGDFDGDGKADLGLYRPSTGYWHVLRSSTNYTTAIAQQWGLSTDVPVVTRP
jgi:hypothetical protein